MLVLSRKLNESIVIGDKVTVTVLKVDRNCVRIGIEAPAEVPIFRMELLEDRHENGAISPVSGSAPHGFE
ncbi:carbon storage regulator CsrA [bacterium]|nr:carbon storage regulator CsrA [bacterium]